LTAANACAHICVMKPIAHIRTNVLKVSQDEMATIAGVNQSTVSRWENEDNFAPSGHAMRRIRDEAIKRHVEGWSDALFFTVASSEQGAAA